MRVRERLRVDAQEDKKLQANSPVTSATGEEGLAVS